MRRSQNLKKNLPPVLTKQLFLLSSIKTSGRLFQIFVAFSEELDFNMQERRNNTKDRIERDIFLSKKISSTGPISLTIHSSNLEFRAKTTSCQRHSLEWFFIPILFYKLGLSVQKDNSGKHWKNLVRSGQGLLLVDRSNAIKWGVGPKVTISWRRESGKEWCHPLPSKFYQNFPKKCP